MGSSVVVVREVASQDAAQVTLAQDEDVVETLAPDRPDETLREGILPRAAGSREDLVDPHALHAVAEGVTVDRVAIAEEVGGGGVVREGVHDLLSGPRSGGMLGNVEVEDPTPMVSKDDQDEEHPQARGGNGEEVDGDQVLDMVGEERSPGLGRRWAPLGDQPGDGALRHLDPKLEELSMDSGRAPQRISGSHFSDEGHDLGVDRRAAPGGPAREPGPVLAETASLPTQDRVGSHEHEGLPPPGPDPGQPHPEEAIRRAQPRPAARSLVHGDLVTQGEVLEGKVAVAAAEQGEETKQMEQEGDH